MADGQVVAVVSIQAKHAPIPFSAAAELYRQAAMARVEADNARRDLEQARLRLDRALAVIGTIEEILGECLEEAWGNG